MATKLDFICSIQMGQIVLAGGDLAQGLQLHALPMLRGHHEVAVLGWLRQRSHYVAHRRRLSQPRLDRLRLIRWLRRRLGHLLQRLEDLGRQLALQLPYLELVESVLRVLLLDLPCNFLQLILQRLDCLFLMAHLVAQLLFLVKLLLLGILEVSLELVQVLFSLDQSFLGAFNVLLILAVLLLFVFFVFAQLLPFLLLFFDDLCELSALLLELYHGHVLFTHLPLVFSLTLL